MTTYQDGQSVEYRAPGDDTWHPGVFVGWDDQARPPMALVVPEGGGDPGGVHQEFVRRPEVTLRNDQGEVTGWSGGGMPTRRRVRRPAPAGVQPGQLVIDVYDPRRDEFGRVSFFMYWHDTPQPDVMAPGGMTPPARAQVFSCDERIRVAQAAEHHVQVFMLGRADDDPGTVPDWTGETS